LHSSQSHDQLHHSLHILCGNGTTISNIYTLSLHDALPILEKIMRAPQWIGASPSNPFWDMDGETLYFSWNPENAAADSLYKISIDRKSTRLNSSHVKISYAVFCLKKKKEEKKEHIETNKYK